MGHRLYYSVLLTLAVLLIVNVLSAYNIYVWVRDVAPKLSPLPSPIHSAIWHNSTCVITCSVAIAIMVLAKKHRAAFFAAMAALSILVLLVLASVPMTLHIVHAAGASALVPVIRLVAVLAWLAFLLWAVISNYALERTDGRGFNVS